MAIVTDKKFHMDNDLRDLVELCIRRKEKKWDNLLIIDGKERSGKSTLAKAICYYYAYQTGKTFSVENVFFQPENLEKFARTHRESIILWDESALGGLSSMWWTRIQQKITLLLMMAGKYGHFYVFVIPSFFRLNKYLAIDRSLGLLHVYSEDLISRGAFACYNEKQKTWIYNSYKKSEMYGKHNSFIGRFVRKNVEGCIIDEEAYEKKKDMAIESIKMYFDRRETSRVQGIKEKLHRLQYRIATELPTKEAMHVGEVSEKTISIWKKHEKGKGNEVFS